MDPDIAWSFMLLYPQYELERRFGGSQSHSEYGAQEKNPCPFWI
jgi:hypothetical protein